MRGDYGWNVRSEVINKTTMLSVNSILLDYAYYFNSEFYMFKKLYFIHKFVLSQTAKYTVVKLWQGFEMRIVEYVIESSMVLAFIFHLLQRPKSCVTIKTTVKFLRRILRHLEIYRIDSSFKRNNLPLYINSFILAVNSSKSAHVVAVKLKND